MRQTGWRWSLYLGFYTRTSPKLLWKEGSAGWNDMKAGKQKRGEGGRLFIRSVLSCSCRPAGGFPRTGSRSPGSGATVTGPGPANELPSHTQPAVVQHPLTSNRDPGGRMTCPCPVWLISALTRMCCTLIIGTKWWRLGKPDLRSVVFFF